MFNNEQQEVILQGLDEFRKTIDSVFVGKTEKWEGLDNLIYDCDIYIFRHPGMGNSKQIIIANNRVSVLTATASFLETLVRQEFCDIDMLKDMIAQVELALKGELK